MTAAPSTSWQSAALSVIEDWRGSDGVITSPDIDGLLSAALLAHTENARLIGVYTTTSLLLFDGATPEDALRALWLDHDISHRDLRCIGQHLVLHGPDDHLPRRHTVTFNPNLFYRQSVQDSFRGRSGRLRDKYPFATVHLLMATLGLPQPVAGTVAYHLLAHADGSWATPVDYPANCRIWFDLMFDGQSITSDLLDGYTESETNLKNHLTLVRHLHELGVASRSSRVSANDSVSQEWSAVQGNQSVDYRRNMNQTVFLDRLCAVLRYVSDATGWIIENPATITATLTGRVETPYPNSIPVGGFDQYMIDNEIFSHAFTNFRTLRYTRDIQLG